ncbi:unnamed protein product [Prunus armeniaca]|uniref:Glycosyltransferase n=1 Tax=Prunus armeniaca TaxID=36596 RepID=A0A6J5UGW4_PRUAR|nr:unnamed protein product [Prunus armeniaca]
MSKTTASPPHIALLPSAGMGHLTPFLRLASMLSSRSCTVTLITASPSVSAAESSHISFFLSQHPLVKHIEFQIIPSKPSSNPTTDDPFCLQFEATNRSVHLLYPSLASASPPLSAIFSDFAVASSFAPVAADLGIPNYIITTTSCKFFCLMAYLPVLLSDPLSFSRSLSEVSIPGVTPMPLPSIPPQFKNPNHLFTSLIATSAQALSKANGILMNTFDDFEPETLAAINSGRVLDNLPPILPIGPLETFEPKKEQDQSYLPWLDSQPEESVVYVSFGSRTAMSSAQIRELSKGLERSGYRFLWVLKTRKVDKDDKEELKDLLEESFLDRTKNKGRVVKGWVSQQDILEHPAIGGFLNHCGWNSVMEAARKGIPMLAWPQHGDQSGNAEVLEKAGLGIWERKWGWGLEGLVSGEEIGKKIVELMEDEKLRGLARKVGENAGKATGIGGKSEKVLTEVLEYLEQKKN